MATKSEEGKKVRQKRTSNFTTREKETLIRIMEKYKHIIECKKTDSMSCKLKHKTWERICVEFNAQTICSEYRPAEKLKLLWDNLKRNTRKHLSSKTQKTYKTGVESNPVKEDLLYLQVNRILDSAIEPMDNAYDDDALEDTTGQVEERFGKDWKYVLDVENSRGVPEISDRFQGNQDSVQSPLANVPEQLSDEKISDEGDEGVDSSEWNYISIKTERSTPSEIPENLQSFASTSEKPAANELLDNVILEQVHEPCQERRANKTPEKSTALIQAKLDYLEILKKEALEKAELEKRILKNTLVQQRLKIILLRRQLKNMNSRLAMKIRKKY